MYIFLSGDHENNESKHTQEYSKEGEKLELSLWAPHLLQIEIQFYMVAHCSAGAGHSILIYQQFNRQRYILSHWYHIECLWWFKIMMIIIVNCEKLK